MNITYSNFSVHEKNNLEAPIGFLLRPAFFPRKVQRKVEKVFYPGRESSTKRQEYRGGLQKPYILFQILTIIITPIFLIACGTFPSQTQFAESVTKYMANILLEEVAKELKLVKVVDTSRYWRSQWPFDVAFRQSHTLLRRSMTVDRPFF